MRIGTLNVGHRARKPKTVPPSMLDALLALECDLLFLTEYVETPEYLEALATRWPFVQATEQRRYNQRGHWSNQVVALSIHELTALPAHSPVPTPCASTNFLQVQVCGVTATGLRAPAYKGADWYTYWDALRPRLDGHVIIGDFNVDPTRSSKRDRVLPEGWEVASGTGPSFQSSVRDASSAIDQALSRNVTVTSARYHPTFFQRWGLDHCPLVVDVKVGATAP